MLKLKVDKPDRPRGTNHPGGRGKSVKKSGNRLSARSEISHSELILFSDRRCERSRERSAMRNADQDIRDPERFTDVFCFSAKLHIWFAAHVINDLDVGPLDTFCPAGSDRL